MWTPMSYTELEIHVLVSRRHDNFLLNNERLMYRDLFSNALRIKIHVYVYKEQFQKIRGKHYDITSQVLLRVNAFIFKSLALAKHCCFFKQKLISKNHLPYKNYIHKQDSKFNQVKAKNHWKKYKAKYCHESIKLLSITE